MAQLKEMQERLAAKERAHLAKLQTTQTDNARRERQLQEEIKRINQQY